ncbi:MAG: hypothetical protein ABIP85_17145, partial [Chthoniobacteraceae bacterium]
MPQARSRWNYPGVFQNFTTLLPKNFARHLHPDFLAAMEKIPFQGQTLTRWRVGNSTFLALPEKGARLM